MFWFISQKSKYYLTTILDSRPNAKATIKGSPEYSQLIGTANFYQTKDGALLSIEVIGLPHNENECLNGIFGLHIHEGSSCTGDAADPFKDVKMHYNPNDCKHPYHAGDLPPLFENDGRAFTVVLTNRFRVDEVIGKAMIIHSMPDDFTTQPAGNAGAKIACGLIKKA